MAFAYSGPASLYFEQIKRRLLEEQQSSTLGQTLSQSPSFSVDTSNPVLSLVVAEHNISASQGAKEEELLNNRNEGSASIEQIMQNTLGQKPVLKTEVDPNDMFNKSVDDEIPKTVIPRVDSSVLDDTSLDTIISLAREKFGQNYEITNANTNNGFMNELNISSNTYNSESKYEDQIGQYDSHFLTVDGVTRTTSLAYNLALLEAQELSDEAKESFSIAGRTLEQFGELVENTSAFINSSVSMRNDKSYDGSIELDVLGNNNDE
jgi:hypothetical protein